MYLKSLQINSFTLKNNILIAPLAGYTNLPSRIIYRKQADVLIYSEMVSALGLKYSYDKSVKILETQENDKPYGIQLFGPDHTSITDAYNKIKDIPCDIIDINCGCSVKKILKSNSGAFLLKSPDKIYKIVKELKNLTCKPVSIKIRSGWDEESINFLEIADAAEKAGVDLITIHPRTRSMLFKGNAKWEFIKTLKKESGVPVIGNGDIFTGEDAQQMFRQCGCDGIMIGRGIIENPFIIEEIITILKGEQYKKPGILRKINTMLLHCELFIKYLGERGILEFRKYIRGYLKGMKNISILRHTLSFVTTWDDFRKTIDEYLKYNNDII